MVTLLARLDRWMRRLVVSTIPPALAVWFYSQTRRWFLERLVRAQPERYVPPTTAGVEYWGLRFQTPIFNAAGMFKDGRGYPTQTDREAWDLVWKRLEIVREKFLQKRKRFVPVVVKFSNDVPLSMVADIVAKLCDLGFDGVNFGNTSTNYLLHRERIHPREQRYYDFFVQNFGGGVSGRPLKEESLLRCLAAVEYLREHPPVHEFIVIRTGGILDAEDITESLQRGIHLCQWYTGYFEQFDFAFWVIRQEACRCSRDILLLRHYWFRLEAKCCYLIVQKGRSCN